MVLFENNKHLSIYHYRYHSDQNRFIIAMTIRRITYIKLNRMPSELSTYHSQIRPKCEIHPAPLKFIKILLTIDDSTEHQHY